MHAPWHMPGLLVLFRVRLSARRPANAQLSKSNSRCRCSRNRSTRSTEPALSECSSISFSCPSSSRHGRRQRRRVTNPAGNPDSDDAADAKRQRGIQLQLWKRICDGQHRLDRNIGDKEWRLQVCKAFMASLRQVGTSSTITIVVDRFVELPPSETIGPWKFRHSASLEASGWW